jgi:hypothetical protein
LDFATNTNMGESPGTSFLLRVSIAGIERKDKRGDLTDTSTWSFK